MKLSRWVSVAAAFAALQLSGCGHIKGLNPGPANAGRLGIDKGDGTASDYPIDFAALIKLAVNVDEKPAKETEPNDLTKPVVSVEEARRYFYFHCGSYERCGTLRNRVQDRLTWASESACTDYLSEVRKKFTATNLNLGGATTLFGALGSVFTSVDAARVFSGAAGVTSGLRAEYNDVYFSSQAFELVSKAVRAVREKTLKQIRDDRMNKDIRDYTLDGAVADAMRYHATCNVMAGLEEASDAVTRERDPGLKRLSELLQDVGAGVNVALGTAALDSSNLPSAQQSCRRLDDIVRDGGAVVEHFIGEEAKFQAGAENSEEQKTRVAAILTAVKALLVRLKATNDGSKTGCAGTDSPVAKAETEMFDAMREFAGLPLSEKAAGKHKFDARRAKVLELKAKIEGVVSVARALQDDIVKKAKLP